MKPASSNLSSSLSKPQRLELNTESLNVHHRIETGKVTRIQSISSRNNFPKQQTPDLTIQIGTAAAERA
jgi:hypothetical protein